MAWSSGRSVCLFAWTQFQGRWRGILSPSAKVSWVFPNVLKDTGDTPGKRISWVTVGWNSSSKCVQILTEQVQLDGSMTPEMDCCDSCPPFPTHNHEQPHVAGTLDAGMRPQLLKWTMYGIKSPVARS